MVLLNSGSSHCFLDAKVATKLQSLSLLAKPLIVQVANGAHLDCDTQLLQAKWQLQGLELCSNFRVLPLPNIDMILGYDWLEQFSPIKIH
jgi:hypothetical protein